MVHKEPLRKAKLLVVDDDQLELNEIESYLTEAGYEVTTANGGRKAVEEARDKLFDLAVLDMKMPGMDGLQVAARLRQLQPYLRVMIFTGYASLETEARVAQLDFYEYLPKSNWYDLLLPTIERVLREPVSLLPRQRPVHLEEAAKQYIEEGKWELAAMALEQAARIAEFMQEWEDAARLYTQAAKNMERARGGSSIETRRLYGLVKTTQPPEDDTLDSHVSGSAISELGKPEQVAQQFDELLAQDDWAVLSIGLNDLQPLVEFYGDVWQNRVLGLVASCLFSVREACGNPADLVFRGATDTFIVITQAFSAAACEENLRRKFRDEILSTFPPGHLQDGLVCLPSLPLQRLPVPALAIGVVTAHDRQFTNRLDLLEEVAKAREKNQRKVLISDLNSLAVEIGKLREEIQIVEHMPTLLPLIERFAGVTTGPIRDLRNEVSNLTAKPISGDSPSAVQMEKLRAAIRYSHFLLGACSEICLGGFGTPRRVDCSRLLAENTSLWKGKVTANIAVEVPPDPVEVYADDFQVEQALTNLLDWLVDRQEACSRITVTCRNGKGRGEIVITGDFDVGLGEAGLVKRALTELKDHRPLLYVFQKLVARYEGCVQFQPGRITLDFPKYQWQDVQSTEMLMEQIQNLQSRAENLRARLKTLQLEGMDSAESYSLNEVVDLGGRSINSLVAEFELVHQEAARQRDEAGEEQMAFLDSIKAVGYFCQLLAANLLALKGEPISPPCATNVEQVLESVRWMLRFRIMDGVELEWNVSPHLPPVRATETTLAQVVLNLALNALEKLARARPQISRLSFTAQQVKDAVQIDISDTGEDLSTEEGGIRLLVVKLILDRFGGTIAFHTAAGKGTTVSITLPIWEGPQ